MKPQTVSLLCRPGSHEPLRLTSVPDRDGATREVLVGVRTGKQFEIRDGIPVLLEESTITGFNRRYRALYDRVAWLYDGGIRWAATIARGDEARFRGEYLRELEAGDGDRVLEVSVGTGANFRFLPVRGEFFGLDLSWGMLQRCRRNLSRWRMQAELIQGNAEDLPLVDDSFDSVLHVGGINAFNDRARAILEMVRVARPGTKVVIVDETARLMEAFGWVPGFRRWMRQFGDRFKPPVDLVPPGMQDVRVTEIAGGNLYCLTFRKP